MKAIGTPEQYSIIFQHFFRIQDFEWVGLGAEVFIAGHLTFLSFPSPNRSGNFKFCHKFQGSSAAQLRKKQLAKQFPIHDVEPSNCHDLTPGEVET